jgi:hypothetical protein
VDDTYLINVARTEYREGFNAGDADRVVSVFAPEFTDHFDGRPTRYGKDAPAKLRQYLKRLFAEHQANLNLITPAIVISGNPGLRLRLSGTYAHSEERRRSAVHSQTVFGDLGKGGRRPLADYPLHR